MDIEDIKKSLAEDYTKALDYFKESNFQDFYPRMRRVIEWYGKLIIYDVIKDEVVFNKIITGQASYSKTGVGNCYMLNPDTPQRETPEGSFFIDLARMTIFYKYPQVANPTARPTRNMSKAIEYFFISSKNTYDGASAIVHTGASAQDKYVHAVKCFADLRSSSKDLDQFLSDETYHFLQDLPMPTPQVVEDIGKEAEKLTNDLTILDEATNNFMQSAGVEYVAFLPEEIKDKYGHPLGKTLLQDFFRLQWCLVVDLDKKTQSGLYEQAPSQKKSTIRIITDNLSEVTGSSILTNWLFAQGRTDLGQLTFKQALQRAPQLFKQTFTKIVRTGSTRDYVIFDFIGSSQQLVTRFLDKLEDVFDSWEHVRTRCKIISFSQDPDYREALQEWADSMDVEIIFVSANLTDFIVHISQTTPKPEQKDDKFLIRGKTLDIASLKELYKAVGIEFFGPSPKTNTDRKWDFYSGAEITWAELDQHCDVQRDKYFVIRRRIDTLLRTNSRRTKLYTLRHRPGSGATTIARRLAYDIKKEDDMGTISCTVIEIKNSSNLRLTEDYISKLSENIDNTPILAIVESKNMSKEKYDRMVQHLNFAGKNVLFFYIEPYTAKHAARDTEDMTLLDSYLNPEEQQRFEWKYGQLGLNQHLLKRLTQGHRRIEVVDFPLMLKDNETCDNVGSYVKAWFEELPDNLKKFCAYVAFVYKYSDSGINQNLLKSLWRDESHLFLTSYGEDTYNALCKILIEETTAEGKFTGIWRPRYNKFSSFILDAYQRGISEMAKSFLALCQEAGQLGSDDMDMLYNVFIIRNNIDYRAIEDSRHNLRAKFSLLINDLNDNERAESLFTALVKAFPNDPVFRGHYARFLYEKATISKQITMEDRLFGDAQEQLRIAFDLKPDDSDLHHMQGMLLRRKLQALYNSQKNTDRAEIDIPALQDFIDETIQYSANAFDRSIELSPSSPYGYAAKSQLYMEAIKFAKWLLDKEDYAFCETDHIYSEYAQKLGDAVDMFENICYTFKNEGLSQIMGAYNIYESVRAFHRTIIGQNKESIQRYRNLYGQAKGDMKSLYGNMLVKSIVYSRLKNKDTRTAYGLLSARERSEIESILDFQIGKGDIKSYETLFMLKLYGPDEYPLDEAIDLLKEWEQQYITGSQTGWGFLNACFYLAVCYSSKAIIGGVRNQELASLAATYFKTAEKLALQFDKGTVREQCYFGDREDIHCIVDKNRKDQEATMVSGTIIRIKNNKGILELPCGIEVTFYAKGLDPLQYEGQNLQGVLGFSYHGPGLYDFRQVSADASDFVYDEADDTEFTIEQLAQEYVAPVLDDDVDDVDTPVEDDIAETIPEADSTDIADDIAAPRPEIKVVGKIELPQDDKGRPQVHAQPDTPEPPRQDSPEPNKLYHGKINDDCTKVYIPALRKYFKIDRRGGFTISPYQCDYNAIVEIVCELKETTNYNTGKPFFLAIKIRPADED